MPALQVDAQSNNTVPMTGCVPVGDLEIQHDPPTGPTSLANYEDSLHAASNTFPVRLVMADFSPWTVNVVHDNGSGSQSWERENDHCWFESGATVNDLQVVIIATNAETAQTKSKTIYIKIKPKNDRPVPS